MTGNTDSGRKPGFKHSDETKRKIGESQRGPRSPETRQRMSEAHRGEHKSEEWRKQISLSKRLHGLEEQCARRLEDLKASYPAETSFFEEYEPELLLAMRDVRTEKELMDIRLYIETSPLWVEEPYKQVSGSYTATEEAMVALLDFKFFLERAMSVA